MKILEPISLCGELSEFLNRALEAPADNFGCSPGQHICLRPVNEIRGPIDWRICGDQDTPEE